MAPSVAFAASAPASAIFASRPALTLRRSRPIAPSRPSPPSSRPPPSCIIRAPPRKPSGTARPRKAPEVLAENDRITSTPGQIAMVATFFALTGVVLARAALATALADAPAVLAVESLAAAAAGWLFADFGTSVYHWSVDNYGSASTPFFGFQIAAFQGHHKAPWTITSRDFANNLYRLTAPTTPQMVLLALAPLPAPVLAGCASALFWIVMSQELHRQAHFLRPAPYARVLQALGLAMSKKEHGRHHSSPFAGHYGIVSGVWNSVLDRTLFFRRLEAIVYRRTGVEPICWKLDEKVKELSLSL